MSKAINWRDNNDHDTSKIREVAEKAKASREAIYEVKDDDGNEFEKRTWNRAYWMASHDVNSGDAGLVFLIFPEEIIIELQNNKNPTVLVEVYAVQYSNLNAPGWDWNGQDVMMRVYIKNLKGKQYKAVEMQYDGATKFTGFQHLGLVGAKSKGEVAIGETKKMQIFTLRRQRGTNLNSSVLLFDPNHYSRDEMLSILAKMKNKGGLK